MWYINMAIHQLFVACKIVRMVFKCVDVGCTVTYTFIQFNYYHIHAVHSITSGALLFQ